MQAPDTLYRIPSLIYRTLGIGLLVVLIFSARKQSGPQLTQVAPSGARANVYQDLGQLRFDSRSARLSPDIEASLQRAASIMNNDPSLDLRLEGYVPVEDIDPAHANIAQQRSIALQRYLAKLGIKSSHVTGSGFLYEKPSAARAGKRRLLEVTSVVAQRENKPRIQIFVR